MKHYGLLSSVGSDAKSMFLYLKVKGQVEQAISSVGVNQLCIYNPGMLLNRRGEKRLKETLGSWVPFLAKIQSVDMGRAMIERAVYMAQESDEFRASQRRLQFQNAQIITDLAERRAQNAAKANL